ncbi:hypothetical protein ILYODFUR_026105 [Ilyodon furcidens]|uniref:Uncharacterized protein n=1 Tax=Ilyodon furcidens TaxID=33524 RepID=A0ABV0T1N1_9TELE
MSIAIIRQSVLCNSHNPIKALPILTSLCVTRAALVLEATLTSESCRLAFFHCFFQTPVDHVDLEACSSLCF